MRGARLHTRRALGAAALVWALVPLGCSSESLAADPPSPPASVDARDAMPQEAATEASEAASATDAAAAVGATICSSAPIFPVCSDGQILAILAAELAAHIDLANAVRPALASTGAIDLAEKLLTDDSVLVVQVQGEMRETGIAAAPGGVDREIAAETAGAIQALAAESAPAIDASYVDREVLAHLRALGLIDRLLAPSVHDPRMADLLARVRDLVVQHVQAASQAQSELEGPCASRSE